MFAKDKHHGQYFIGRPQGKIGGLGKFCLKKGTIHQGTAKKVVSEEKTADVMTQELHDHYRDGYTLQYDVPLNKFMVDYDIKEFIIRGHSPIKKPVYFLFRKKNGFDFPRYQKKH